MNNETTLWTGTPSQAINFWPHVWGVLFCWLVIPVCILLWRRLVTKNTLYELTSEQLRTRHGVLNKELQVLELYRVKDYRVNQPLLLRLFNVANITLETSDLSTPVVVMYAVTDAENLVSTIRNQVELLRQKRVREVNMF